MPQNYWDTNICRQLFFKIICLLDNNLVFYLHILPFINFSGFFTNYCFLAKMNIRIRLTSVFYSMQSFFTKL